MDYIKVLSFDHLDELLSEGYSEFSAHYGQYSFSREITFSDDSQFPYEVFSYVDGSSATYTRKELEEYLFMLPLGALYAEPMR